MSTPASGPDSGKPDERGTPNPDGGGPLGPDPAPHRVPDGEQPFPEGQAPFPQQPSGQDPYQPGTYAQGPSGPNQYAQDPYAQAPYPQAGPPSGGYGGPGPGQDPYPSGGYGRPGPSQGPYAQGGYLQGGYGQGPYGQQPYGPQKSRVIAGVLGILLGSLGVHRFYLGYTTIGVVLVLMSTVGAVFTFGLSAIAAGIWGLVEGILILVGSGQFRRDAQGIPLKD